MLRTPLPSRSRPLASAAVAMTLCVAAASLASGPASSAPPVADCAAAFPVAELTRGDAVDGLTVSSGTEPEAFTGDVLGVLADGIGPDLDLVMVELSSPAIGEAGGIWQGMSGSPVYAADGRLIGAVAYGLALGASPVAGVTPFEDMDDYLGTTLPGLVDVPAHVARRIAARTGVTPAQAAQGFAQLPMPMGVSGVTARRLAQAAAQGDRPYLAGSSTVIGKAAAAAGPETIVAGGNMAASVSYGDITQAGVGTATSVCHGRVVGFGHPLTMLGETSLALHPAEAIYIQRDLLAPFKVANIAAPVGTVDDDHLTGITGSFGALPDTTTVTSTVTHGVRSRTGSTKVSVAEANPATTFYQILANHDRVVDGIAGGSEELSWAITGSDADGTPFRIAFADRFASGSDLTFEVGYEVADLVFWLSSMPGVTIDRVVADSLVDSDSSTYRVTRIEQRVGGAWRRLGRGQPAVVRAGRTLLARAVLRGPDGTTTAPVSFRVPRRAAGSRVSLEFIGGNSLYTDEGAGSVSKLKRLVAGKVRNDEVQASFGTGGSDYYGDFEMLFRGGAGFDKTKNLGPLAKVTGGHARVSVLIR